MAVAVTGWSMLADVTDVDELLSGQRREGMYYGVIAFAQTATAALVVWLAAWCSSWWATRPTWSRRRPPCGASGC